MKKRKDHLELLTKSQLIEIIKKDSMCYRMAANKAERIVFDKINEILDKQDKIDFSKIEDRIKYTELEKEYKKWEEIHDEQCGII